MFNLINAPGLHYIGEVSNQQVNGGRPLPLFEPVTPADCRNINTLEGWQKLAAEQSRRCFIEDFGREPENDAELKAYVDRLCRGAEVV